MKKKIFTLLLAVAASVGTIFAERVQIGDLYYNLNTEDKTAEVTCQYWRSTDNYSSLTTVNIPSSVSYNDANYSVTGIGDYAFYGCTGLSSIEIPNSVTSIGEGAFDGCSSLTSIELPNSVTSIGIYAFAECSGLTSIVIPNSVTSIGGSAFSECTGLTSVTIPNSVTSIGAWAFQSCSGLTSVTIPNSVTSIGEGTFQGCSSLTSVTIPNSVTSIGHRAYSGCSSLTSVTIPNSVTSIGKAAFEGCTGLTSIEIPNSVTSIAGTAFQNCSGIKSLKLSANWVKDGSSYGCLYICGMIDYQGTISSNDTSYYWMQRLESIEAPAWFFDVEEKNWSYCPKKLEKVVVNNGELSDNDFAVIGRSYKTLQSLDLSAVSNTDLTDEAIKNFYNITELKLPSNAVHIGYMSVAECVKLQSIFIPASVTEIEDRAFENCRSLKSITFGGSSNPASVRFNAPASSASQLQRIGSWAFYNCHELQNLEIPEGVTEIGDGAFYGCTYLEELSLPASVQSIGDNTFALCAKMKKIIVNAVTPPTIQAKTFFDVKRQIPVYVPNESVDAYKDDAYWGELNIIARSQAPTGIDNTSADQPKATKLIREGNVYILRGDKTYTVTGQEIK